jgi:hypothetical protein
LGMMGDVSRTGCPTCQGHVLAEFAKKAGEGKKFFVNESPKKRGTWSKGPLPLKADLVSCHPVKDGSVGILQLDHKRHGTYGMS